MSTAWKIFKKGHSGGLVSAVADGRALIRYERGVRNLAPGWLRKKGYYPLVFKRKKDAVYFARFTRLKGSSRIIERVKIGKKIPLPQICEIAELGHGKIIPDFNLPHWPQGTIMVEWVKPFEKEK